MLFSYSLALHGGAGTIASDSKIAGEPYHQALLEALARGRAVLASGGGALDAVVETVVALEDCPRFNAGHGAVFCSDETHELDASVMEGNHRAAGAVTGVRTIRNPVRAALEVMRDGRCVLLGADGAQRLAARRGLELVEPDYFSTPARRTQLHAVRAREDGRAILDHDAAEIPTDAHRFGTVGAVARDRHGRLAAATSTGGMTNKLPGRIGDTPIVGAGIFADDATCAVSCTGTGEHFVRGCIAHDVHARILYLGQDVEAASRGAIEETLAPLGGLGGLVAIDRAGRIAMPFNSRGMYRAWVREGQAARSAIFA
jgi:beta-aspartyl-peptidase (threonine type)